MKTSVNSMNELRIKKRTRGTMKEVKEENLIFIARQAIFNEEIDVFGYELLYRDGNTATANVIDDNQATSKLIINSFVELGIENITNNKFAFVNLTRDFLIEKIPLPLNPENVILEVLEDINADPECLAGLKKFKDRGFTIALDDFIISDANRDLIPLADIIKVDILPMSEEEIRQQVAELKKYPVKLLAEKVETEEEFQLCKELGFDYFQGYFFSKPKIISGKELPTNHLAMLEIIAKLQSPDCDLNEIEEIISLDVGISYKLLKIINSSFYGLTTKVDSIQRVLIVLGLKALSSWITVISLSMVENKPHELISLSLLRAKMCEKISKSFDCKEDAAFTVGLFSLLDALMDQPLPELLESLPLSQDVIEALTKTKGSLGKLLMTVKAYENADWDNIPEELLENSMINDAYLYSLNWSQEITSRI